jgi:hypothetical protein
VRRTALSFVLLLVALNIVRRWQHDNAYAYFHNNGIVVAACLQWKPMDRVTGLLWKCLPGLRWTLNSHERPYNPWWTYLLVSQQPEHMMLIHGKSLDIKCIQHLNRVMGLEAPLVSIELLSPNAIEPLAVKDLTPRARKFGVRVEATITKEFVRALAVGKRYSALRLLGTGIEDGALQELASCEGVKVLEIPEAWMTSVALDELRRELPDTTIRPVPGNIVSSLLQTIQTYEKWPDNGRDQEAQAGSRKSGE